ncbi:protein kinase domain-containing protein, partial [Haematococcus lacustris]
MVMLQACAGHMLQPSHVVKCGMPSAWLPLQGLGHLHSCNVVHGDIKPANVLLSASPSDARGYTAQLADFGLARALQPGQGITFQGKSTVGTASYMSPEALLEGKLSYQSDIFSLGMCLFEMVHGVGAHEGHSMRQVLLSALHSDLPQWQAPDEAQLPGLKSIYFSTLALNLEPSLPWNTERGLGHRVLQHGLWQHL